MKLEMSHYILKNLEGQFLILFYTGIYDINVMSETTKLKFAETFLPWKYHFFPPCLHN